MIFIINGRRALGKAIKGMQSGPKVFYQLPDKNQHCRELLEGYGCSEIKPKRLDGDSREKFLREYIDLIGSIGRECNSKIWWATDMASKNRETSRLPLLLWDYLSIIDAISAAGNRNLLIVNPPGAVIDSLKEYLSGNKIEYREFSSPAKKFRKRTYLRARSFARVFYVLLYVCIRKIIFGFKLRKKLAGLSREKSYYVVKTFLYDHSFGPDGIYRDVFFGSLLDFLKQTQPVIVLANVLGKCRGIAEKIRRCREHLILPMEIFLSFGDAVKAGLETLSAKIYLKSKVLFFGLDVKGIVNAELSRTYCGIDFYQLLHYSMMRRLLECLKVDSFLLTYENNPWEKMSILAVREFSPEIAVIGYQHTCVPKAAAKLFISSHESDVSPLPDRILTVGEMPKRILERYGSYQKIPIEAACGLRFEYMFNTQKHFRTKRGRLLLVTDGLEGTHTLINYAIKELGGSQIYRVLVRTHPALPFDALKDRLTFRLQDLPNFEVSRNSSVREDIEWADVVMYWGSTVCFEALKMGKPVIRYDMDPMMSNDPLFECRHLKWTVTEDTSLKDTLQQINELPDRLFEEAQVKAAGYIRKYFFPVSKEKLELFLPRKRSTAHALA